MDRFPSESREKNSKRQGFRAEEQRRGILEPRDGRTPALADKIWCMLLEARVAQPVTETEAARLAAPLCARNRSRGSSPAPAGASWRSRPVSRRDGCGAAIVYACRCTSRAEMGFFPGWLDQGLRQAYCGVEAARACGKISLA